MGIHPSGTAEAAPAWARITARRRSTSTTNRSIGFAGIRGDFADATAFNNKNRRQMTIGLGALISF
jgi:hypothetical protein